ncbi:thioesterase family protein [Saccharopolyspora gloriosae]|uniref:acyl-CoA thioesterase n=1 Tax=Saccharopolyspora gloriosae TaxID=455344 RepID=UPI001FB6A22C|nr:thioesterase family protein [Saccharopolyspora gloriosae]
MVEPAESLPAREDFTVLWPITTRWADNDVYGHINNVVHYSWFDTAVNGWLMRATGADIREMPEIGLVVETNCRYLAELGFPDDVEVGVGLERVGNSSVVYRLAVFGNGAAEPASLGRFVHVYVDRETRRPARVPERIRTVLADLPVFGG